MNAKQLAHAVLRQLDFQEGWCSFCHRKVGNALDCNDKYHTAGCAIHKLRDAAKQ